MLNYKNISLLLFLFFSIQGLFAQTCDYIISPSTHHNWIDVVAQKKSVSVGLGTDSTILRNSKKIQVASEPLDANDDLVTRTFIRFDLFSNIYNSCGWSNVYLHLRFTGDSKDSHSVESGPNNFIVSRIIEDWGDDTLRWKTPPASNPYRMPLTTKKDQVNVKSSSKGTEDFEILLSNFFNFWREYPDSNFGIEIRLANEQGTRGLNFTSSEFSSPLVWPYIEATAKSCAHNLAEAGENQIICTGQTAQLDGKYGEFFEWRADPTLSNRYVYNPVVEPTKTTTYYLKTTLGNCSSEDSVTIQVDDYPSIKTSSNVVICDRDTVEISVTGALNYSWTPENNLDPTSSNPKVHPNKTTFYYVVADNNSPCSVKDSVKVIVVNLPKTNAGSDRTICEGDTAFLLVSGAKTYEWVGNTTGLSATNINDPEATPTVTTTYTVEGSNGTCKLQDEVTVTVVPKYTVDAGEDDEICLGEDIFLDGQVGFPFYKWEPSNVLSQSTIPRPNVDNLQATTTFKLTVADANQCTATDEVTITVNPVPELTIGQDTFVCITESVDIEVESISDGDFTYHWDEEFGISDTNARDVNIQGLADTILIYTLTIEDVNGCKASDDIVITTLPELAVDVFGGDTTICSGSIIEIRAEGGLTYQWEGEDILSTLVSRNTIKVNPSKPTTYSVTVSNGEKCGTVVALVDIDVIQKPTAYAHLPNTQREQDTVFVCKGREVTLEGVGAEQYIWSTGDTAETTTIRLLTDNNIYTVYGISKGCQGDADEILLKINQTDTCFSTVYVPNAFNPFSAEPENQVFTIYPFLIRDYKLTVFDRWGTLLFQTEDQKEFWDGYHNGALVPEGVYYYLIEAFGTDEESRSSNGTVQVIY